MAPLCALGILLATLAAAGPGAAQAGDLPAPATTLSSDGRSATDGVRRLSVSKAAGIDPAGESINVQGAGYDTFKGIYVAFCVIPPTNYLPTPCGGGMDHSGASGASAWVSSNPPDYGVGLAFAYGPGGSFSVNIAVVPAFGSIDCRRVRCAIVTRNDHTRSTDRSQDIFIPISFAEAPATPPAGPAPTSPPTAGGNGGQPSTPGQGGQGGGSGGGGSGGGGQPSSPATPEATTTVPVTTIPPPAPDQDLPAPEVELGADGTSATFGSKGVLASKVADLDPDGDQVTVTGFGFDLARGMEVALCAVDAGTGEFGPCLGSTAPRSLRSTEATAAQAEAESVWVTSNPPARRDREPIAFEPGGAFSAELHVRAAIDGSTDCRDVACAVVVRSDFTRPNDRSQDVALPVTFTDDRPPPSTTTEPDDGEEAAPAAASTDTGADSSGGGNSAALIAGAAALVVAGSGVAIALARRRGAAS